MSQRLLQLDDVRNTDSPDKVANLFQKLGYNATRSAQPLAVSDLELPARSTEVIEDSYLIADHQKGATHSLQVLLFQLKLEEWETPSTASNRMRAIAQSLCRRPSKFLLVGTQNYKQLMLVNPRTTLDAQMNVKTNIRKLLIDRTNPTAYDRDRLEAIAARDLDPQALYNRQCEAFDVEKLTKEFYKGYKDIFEQVQRVIREYNPHPYFNDASRLHQFSQRLLGRVMFLYFLQKKEFLGNDRDFLKNQYNRLKPEPEDTEFYTTLLEPLFFEMLNKERPNFESPWGKIPYLNGGLFDRDYGNDVIDTAGFQTPEQLILPNSLFDPSGERGVLKFFNGYNFTVSENVQGDEDVAVDPEMLGKVFENMLAAEERGQSGTFYTPRGIVHFMCVESLSRYLADESGIDLEVVKQLAEFDPDLPDVDLSKLFTRSQAKTLKKAIETVKVCDPAVGSGAFPLGMMQVILAVRLAIAHYEGMTKIKRGSFTISEWKREIIANNLYGVDIKPEAIEIAKLRMWLSMVVDIPTIDKVEPLPNLDYKLMAGNSLISTIAGEHLIPDPTQDRQLGLIVTPLQEEIQKLVALQEESFLAHAEERKVLRERILEAEKLVFQFTITNHRQSLQGEQRRLEQDIKRMGKGSKAQTQRLQAIDVKLKELDSTEIDITAGLRSLDFFQWHLHFNDVFQQKGGFDVVIGNPPYDVLNITEGHHIAEEKLEEIKSDKTYEVALGGKLNLFRLFLAKSLKLSNNTGETCLIIPYGFMSDSSSKKIRSYILENKSIAFIEAFPERDNPNQRLFESAKMSTCIVLIKSSFSSNSFPVRTHYSRDIRISSSEVFLNREVISSCDPNNLSIPLMSQQDLEIVKKMCHSGIRISDIGRCYEGEINLTFHKKYLREESENNISMIKGAAVQKYFLPKKMSQGKVEYLDHKLYLREVNSPKSKHHRFSRIVMQGITGVNERSRLKMTLLDENIFCGNSVNYILFSESSIDPESILGILNSRLLNWFFKLFSTNSNVNGYEVDNLPMPSISSILQTKIKDLVRELLNLRSSREYFNENVYQAEITRREIEIDQIVYGLYGLTNDEKELIDSKGKL